MCILSVTEKYNQSCCKFTFSGCLGGRPGTVGGGGGRGGTDPGLRSSRAFITPPQMDAESSWAQVFSQFVFLNLNNTFSSFSKWQTAGETELNSLSGETVLINLKFPQQLRSQVHVRLWRERSPRPEWLRVSGREKHHPGGNISGEGFSVVVLRNVIESKDELFI